MGGTDITADWDTSRVGQPIIALAVIVRANWAVRFAEKPWLKILFADLLWEKNTIPTEKNKLKSTDYKTSEQGQLPLSLFKCHYGVRADQIFLSLTKFIKNISNICISK
jgi:hypothetical protein